MAFDIASTLETVHNHLAASGYFSGGVQVGEYMEPPDAVANKLAGSIYMQSSQVAMIMTDGATRELHVVVVRIYADLKDPTESPEKKLAQGVSQVSSDMLGDADLGETIMAIDAGGAYGTNFGVAWGRVDISQRMYRVADVTLPLIVDGSATVTS